MQPVKSNLAKESCAPVSSNCVIWQGPNLPCIGLCTGDSVSEVIYRIAEDFCAFKANFNFTDVDLQCILTVCTTVPEPQKTLNNILNLIVNKVCCMNDIVVALQNAQTPDEIQVTLANCFNITNSQGVPLTQLPVSEYVYQIGLKICQHATTLSNHEIRITTLEGQVATLIGTPPPSIPQVTPNCILVPGVPTDIDVVVDELESQFCTLTAALGPNSEITKVLSRQCATLSTQPSLVTGGSMNSLTGWVTVPQNLAQTLQNLWITVCDLRGAVKFIQDTCCKVTCDDITANFEVAYAIAADPNTGANIITLTLFFGVDGVNIPTTFYDCDQTLGTKLTISDQHGHSITRYVLIRNNPANGGSNVGILDGTPTEIQNGTELIITGSQLVKGDDLTITSDICLTDGTTTCVKCVNILVPYQGPDCEYCVITNTSSNQITVTYKVCLL